MRVFLESCYYYLCGYQRICVEGFFLERFLNLCMNRGIELWNVEKITDIQMLVNIKKKDVVKVKDIANTTRCRMTLQFERGFIHFFQKYRKRKIALLGVFLGIAGVISYTSRIWHIEVIGDFKIPIEELYQELNTEKVKKGVLKKNLDFQQIKNNIYLRRNDIAWMGFEVKGTKALIKFVERTVANIMDEEALPCDIVADKDGIVEKIIVKEGTKAVQVGDYVRCGDILISGMVEGKESSKRLVHSEGKILVRTCYQAKACIPYEKDIPTRTGREARDYQLILGKYKINLRNTGTNFEKYDTITKEEDFVLFGKKILPIRWQEKDYQELSVNTIQYTKEQAMEVAKLEALQQLKTQIAIANDGISSDAYQIIIAEQYVIAELKVECMESIGKKQIIAKQS